jgi:RHS repeat-associated protein
MARTAPLIKSGCYQPGWENRAFWSHDGSTPAPFLRDAMNSTIGLVNSSGSIIDQSQYDPHRNTTDTSSTQLSPFEFTGRENEGGGFAYTNLYFMRGRYYDPQLARFISRDPSGLSGGTNMYEYAADDPVDSSDPTGTCGDNTGCAPPTRARDLSYHTALVPTCIKGLHRSRICPESTTMLSISTLAARTAAG